MALTKNDLHSLLLPSSLKHSHYHVMKKKHFPSSLSVRPKPNQLLAYRLLQIIQNGRMDSMNECLFDDDDFVFRFVLQPPTKSTSTIPLPSSPQAHGESRILVLDIFCPEITRLWMSGGKELVTHFLAQSVDSITLTQDKGAATLRLSFDLIRRGDRFKETENLVQHIAYIRFLLLMAPIFKYFRRLIYGTKTTSLHPCVIPSRKEETVWIFNQSKQFLLALWTKKPHTLLEPYRNFLYVVFQKINEQLHSEKGIQRIQQHYALRFPPHLLLALYHITQQLIFSYQAERPPKEVADYCTQHHGELPQGGHWFVLNLLKCNSLKESDLFPMCKIVVGLECFLRTSFCHQMRHQYLQLNAAATSIAFLSHIPTVNPLF